MVQQEGLKIVEKCKVKHLFYLMKAFHFKLLIRTVNSSITKVYSTINVAQSVGLYPIISFVIVPSSVFSKLNITVDD
jgi:hypothetical protein|tara:strand:+ start:395 stop:625 length:231 start_codon:yes stop_codon:yes gene_type:complete